MKKKLLEECASILDTPKVRQWYKENLESESQYHTISSLEKGVSKNELSIKEALSIALIVGVQWNIKFKVYPKC